MKKVSIVLLWKMSVTASKPQIIATLEQKNGKVFELSKANVIIGYDKLADIQINDLSLAKKFVEIKLQTSTRLNADKKYVVSHKAFIGIIPSDYLYRSLPVYVNDKVVIKQMAIKNGDTITFGKGRHVFTFSMPPQVNGQRDVHKLVYTPRKQSLDITKRNRNLFSKTDKFKESNQNPKMKCSNVKEDVSLNTPNTYSVRLLNMGQLKANFSPSVSRHFSQINAKSKQIIQCIKRQFSTVKLNSVDKTNEQNSPINGSIKESLTSVYSIKTNKTLTLSKTSLEPESSMNSFHKVKSSQLICSIRLSNLSKKKSLVTRKSSIISKKTLNDFSSPKTTNKTVQTDLSLKETNDDSKSCDLPIKLNDTVTLLSSPSELQSVKYITESVDQEDIVNEISNLINEMVDIVHTESEMYQLSSNDESNYIQYNNDQNTLLEQTFPVSEITDQYSKSIEQIEEHFNAKIDQTLENTSIQQEQFKTDQTNSFKNEKIVSIEQNQERQISNFPLNQIQSPMLTNIRKLYQNRTPIANYDPPFLSNIRNLFHESNEWKNKTTKELKLNGLKRLFNQRSPTANYVKHVEFIRHLMQLEQNLYFNNMNTKVQHLHSDTIPTKVNYYEDSNIKNNGKSRESTGSKESNLKNNSLSLFFSSPTLFNSESYIKDWKNTTFESLNDCTEKKIKAKEQSNSTLFFPSPSISPLVEQIKSSSLFQSSSKSLSYSTKTKMKKATKKRKLTKIKKTKVKTTKTGKRTKVKINNKEEDNFIFTLMKQLDSMNNAESPQPKIVTRGRKRMKQKMNDKQMRELKSLLSGSFDDLLD